MSPFAIFLVCFWITTVVLAVWHRQVFHWFTHQFQKQKVKKTIHKVLVEPRADPDALAFALAVSEIQSKDLYAASDVHPAIKNRFKKKQKEKIAEQAFLLRKDEHDGFYFDSENAGTKLYRVLMEERRRSYDVPPPPPPAPNPLIRELRRSLREMADRMERQRTQQVVEESPGQEPEHLVKMVNL